VKDSSGRKGFTLTELLTVLGLIAVLLSLLLPVLGKTRAAAQSTACLSNLRQMSTVWMVYTTESRGRFMDYIWHVPGDPTAAWDGYWPGILARNGVRNNVLICPSASDLPANGSNRGYGDAETAWSGKYAPNGSAIKMTSTNYRDGSYGFNRYLTNGGGFSPDNRINNLSVVRRVSEVPVFFDCAYVDAKPINGLETDPVQMPEDLKGIIHFASPDHFRILMARHGRGINVGFADSSARWVSLEELYMLSWQSEWNRYRLILPAR